MDRQVSLNQLIYAFAKMLYEKDIPFQDDASSDYNDGFFDGVTFAHHCLVDLNDYLEKNA